ncbi:ArnT family glycosyltransferase [Mucilaginibacter sp. AW1-3]
MPQRNVKSAYINFILIFVLFRIVLNVFALPHYGFQRDEMLHLALGDHLAWGFKEVPPFIAWIAAASTWLFGSSVAAARIFTTLCAGLIVLLTGLTTVEFGGRRFAITVACLSITLSPAFLASDYLLQPVVFDQLWWLLSGYLLVKYYNTRQDKYLYFLGVVIGMGLLTKYTMAFYTLALIIGIGLTKHRKMLWSKGVLVAVIIAILIFLPNIIWQLTHHLPLVTHMRKLRSGQLDYIKPADFLIQQVLVNGSGLWVWLVGIIFLLFSYKLRTYRFLAWAYLATLALFLLLNGKIYYLFGAYPVLFAAGGFGLERLLKARSYIWRAVVLLFVTAPNLLFFPLSLPVVPIKSALPLFAFIRDKMGVDFPFKWEGGKIHPTTQDYGDMFGWDELTEKVAKAYYSLTPEQQKQTIIFANNYGEAGAIHHYGKLYHLPDVHSLSSSFALWEPDSLDCKYLIYVDDKNGGNTQGLLDDKRIGAAKKMGEIDNPLAREIGTAIFILSDLKPGLNAGYRKELLQTRSE